MEKEHNSQSKASGEILKHLDLFSGIGGFSLAAQWVWQEEHEIVAFCEIDKFCHKVLRKNFGDIPIYDDIKQLDGTKFTGIDLLTGGFPCQPFSVAGKRKGNEDDRALWPEMLRIIQEIKPRWIIGENVAGFVNMALDQSITDLENEGYEVQTFIIPACAVNAPHRRDRCWIVAHTINGEYGAWGRQTGKENGLSEINREALCSRRTQRTGSDASHTRCEYGEGQTLGFEHEETDRQRTTIELERPITRNGNRTIGHPVSNGHTGGHQTTIREVGESEQGGMLEFERTDRVDRHSEITGVTGGTYGQGQGEHGRAGSGLSWDKTEWYEVATRFCRIFNGLSDKLHELETSDRTARLKSLGNAIVPQVVYEIMKCIKEIDDTPTTLP